MNSSFCRGLMHRNQFSMTVSRHNLFQHRQFICLKPLKSWLTFVSSMTQIIINELSQRRWSNMPGVVCKTQESLKQNCIHFHNVCQTFGSEWFRLRGIQEELYFQLSAACTWAMLKNIQMNKHWFQNTSKTWGVFFMCNVVFWALQVLIFICCDFIFGHLHINTHIIWCIMHACIHL